jgi:hypothetical protein
MLPSGIASHQLEHTLNCDSMTHNNALLPASDFLLCHLTETAAVAATRTLPDGEGLAQLLERGERLRREMARFSSQLAESAAAAGKKLRGR